jgi:protein-tyrosine-phosphatase
MARLPSSVLFACGFNSIRSPMAEAMLKQLHGRRIYVDSVGVRAAPVDPFAVAVMAEIGLDLSRHSPKIFAALEDNSFDLIVSLAPEAQHQAVELTRTTACDVEFWPVFDPTATEGSREEILAAYRALRDLLRRRIRERFPPG